MPKVLAQSNLPNSAAVVVSSETIILRDPNNRILEKYTSDEQKQLSLKSYGIKPATLLSPGENKTSPISDQIHFYRWLQNIGNAYIDSLVKPKSGYKYEFAVVSHSDSIARIFGSRCPTPDDPSINAIITAFISNITDSSFTLSLYMMNGSGRNPTIPGIPNNFAKVVIDNGKVFVNDEEKAEVPDLTQEVVVDTNLFVFSNSNNGTPQFGGSMYLAYFKIYDEGRNILRNFVPASQRGVFGLYDKVSATLFVNANEDGSFVGGNDESIIQIPNTFGFGTVNTPEVIYNDNETM